MAISASGTVSLSTVRTEWGRSGAIKMSEMYRGGSHVRSLAADNNATNLASSVPASGTITLNNFRGTAKGFRYTFSAGATNQNASVLFGADYSVNYPKQIVIDSGVELGATSTSEEALEIDSGGAGTITVTNNGTLSGAGGGVGAAGGDAFEAAVNCTFVNNGTIRAGGGGGGAGGNGGGGSYSSSSQTGNGTSNYWTVSKWWWVDGYTYWAGFDGTNFGGGGGGSVTSRSIGNSVYYRGNYVQSMDGVQYYYIYRVTNNTYSTNGGAGGSGAVGAGYGQSAGTGSSGSGGGTNAGSGGAGGNGGAYGSSGTSGGTGANGNASNGSAGVAGGASGKYLRGSSFITFTNNGTALGGTA